MRTLSRDLCTLVEEIKQLGVIFTETNMYDVSKLNSMYADSRRRFAKTNDRIGEIIPGSQRPIGAT